MIELEESWNKYAELSLKEMTKATKTSLRKAAMALKKQAQRNMIAELGDAATSRGKYFDTLIDAIIVSKYNKRDDSIKVHTMGRRSRGSGTFRARFFEGGTVGRQTTGVAGRPYSNKDLPAHKFFESAIYSTPTDDIIEVEINKAVDKINKSKIDYTTARMR